MLTPSPWMVLFYDLQGRGYRERLCETIRQAVHRGHLIGGQKMPSSRQLAADLSLSRVTTEAVYSQLESEGYLVRYQGKGSFVSPSIRAINRSSSFPPCPTDALSPGASDCGNRRLPGPANPRRLCSGFAGFARISLSGMAKII